MNNRGGKRRKRCRACITRAYRKKPSQPNSAPRPVGITQRCAECGVEKQARQFTWNTGGKSLRKRCIACHRRRWRARKGKQAAYLARVKAEAAQRHAARPASARKQRSQAIRACVDQIIASDPSASGLSPSALTYRALYRFDPEFRAKQIERMHRKKSESRGEHLLSDGSLNKDAIAALFASAQDCLYCGERMRSRDKTLDHIIPRSCGGWHSVRNAVICCFSCNSRKHALMPDEWIERVPLGQREIVRRAWARVQSHTDQLWLVA